MNKKLLKLLSSKKPEEGCVQLWIGTEEPDSDDKQMQRPDYERVRIIFPNGKTEWQNPFGSALLWMRPCWDICQESKSSKEAVKKMKAYDKARGAKTVFLCNVDVEYFTEQL